MTSSFQGAPSDAAAGIEGTGHHFFDFVGHRLRYLSEPTEILAGFANEAYNDLQRRARGVFYFRK